MCRCRHSDHMRFVNRGLAKADVEHVAQTGVEAAIFCELTKVSVSTV